MSGEFFSIVLGSNGPRGSPASRQLPFLLPASFPVSQQSHAAEEYPESGCKTQPASGHLCNSDTKMRKATWHGVANSSERIDIRDGEILHKMQWMLLGLYTEGALDENLLQHRAVLLPAQK